MTTATSPSSDSLVDSTTTNASQRADHALRLARDLARQWPVIVIAGLLALAAVGAREWTRPRTYTSSATFVLQGGRTTPSLSGFASQFGISLPTGDPGQSPALYVEVLRSRTVLSAVAHAAYCDPCTASGPNVSLARLLHVTEPDTGRLTAESVRKLQQMVGGAINPKNGIVTLTATALSATLAQQIAQRTLGEVTRFNLQSRQSMAGAERRFTEGRLEEVGNELHGAEQRLRAFRESNRFASLSPDLQLREDQLDREVRRYEEVYSALARNVEQSKIDEVRDTPTIIVVDAPALPYLPNSRGVVLKAIFGGLVGATLAAAFLAWRAVRARAS